MTDKPARVFRHRGGWGVSDPAIGRYPIFGLSRRSALLILHRDDLRVVACGPHGDGRYTAFLLFPPEAGGETIAEFDAGLPTPEAAVWAASMAVLLIARREA